MSRLVIVGGSDAGISAGLRAREVDPTWDVTLVVADAYPNFSICGLPFFLSGETPTGDPSLIGRGRTWKARAWSCCSITASSRSTLGAGS